MARGGAPRSDLHGRPEQDRPVALGVHICAAILDTCHACVVVASTGYMKRIGDVSIYEIIILDAISDTISDTVSDMILYISWVV